MAKKIDWLDNFAESYAKTSKVEKTASVKKEKVLLDKNSIPNAKVGKLVQIKNKLYKIADLDYTDEKGSGIALDEVGEVENTEKPAEQFEQTPGGPVSLQDPMSMKMGTPVEVNDNASAQEYARTNPGDVYHYEIRDDVEQPAFEEAARETAQEIEKERAFDRSRVEDHYVAPKDMPGTAFGGEVNSDQATEEVSEPVAEEVTETPKEEVEEDVEEVTPDEEEKELPKEEDKEVVEEDKDEKVATRYNRILRRIMASK